MFNVNLVTNTVRIDILNPKAAELLEDLADLKLIAIKKDSGSSFEKLLEKLRSKADSAPSLDEISSEVALERKKRYEKR